MITPPQSSPTDAESAAAIAAETLTVTSGGGTVSSGNSSTTPLNAGIEFEGTAISNAHQFSALTVNVATDVAGTLYMEQSPDGTNWDRSKAITVDPSAASNPPHTLAPIMQYARVRYVNGGTNQGYFRLQTLFRQMGVHGLITTANETISNANDVSLGRNILMGATQGGIYINVGIDNDGHLEITNRGQETIFGGMDVVPRTPVVQVSWIHGSIEGLTKETIYGGASTSYADGQATITTAASANSALIMESTRRVRYRPGEGVLVLFTSGYSAGAAGSYQVAGVLDAEQGWGVGRDGTAVGVLHRYGGKREIQTLTITTKSSTAENATVTIDGSAVSVAVTNGADTDETAAEIAQGDYSSAGTEGWDAYNNGSTVVFIARQARAATDTFSISGTTVVGSFAETRAGAAPTDDWTAQAAFSKDHLDGDSDATNPTGIDLDPASGNIWAIGFGWLGYSGVTYFVREASTGHLQPFHRLEWENANNVPTVANPTLPLRWETRNTTNTTAVSMFMASGSGFAQGLAVNLGPRTSARADVTSIGTSTHHLFTVRPKPVLAGVVSEAILSLESIRISVEHTKPMIVELWSDATYADAPVFEDLGAAAEVSYTTTTISGGTFVDSYPLAKAGTLNELLNSLQYEIGPGEQLIVTSSTSSGSGGETLCTLRVHQGV